MDLDTLTLSLLQQTAQYFLNQQQQAYLVGGSIRNLLFKEPCLDWDIITDGNVSRLARGLADTLGGYYAHLHEKASRVIIKEPDQEIIFDISPLHGHTVEDDLRERDFTINAIAAPLTEIVRYIEATPVPRSHGRGDALRSPWGAPLQLIDPLHGIADIEARRLRAVNDEVFQRDPLRMLRAVRLATRYQLHIDPATEQLIKRDAPLLTRVAPERVHDELYAILAPRGATKWLRLLDELGLLTLLIPEFVPARGMRQPSPHYWDVLEHSLESVGTLERLALMMHNVETRGQRDLDEIRNLLVEAERQNVFQRATLVHPRMKLAALLHDIGKPATYTVDEAGAIHFYNHPQAGVPLAQQIMTRLSASTQDRRLVQLVTGHHMRPGQLGHDGPVTIRATRRYFVDLGPTGIAIALFSLADHLATAGPQFDSRSSAWERHVSVVRLLLTRYIHERESILPPRLLRPEELIRRLQLEPGPLIGQLLEAIAEAQADGSITSKEEALWFAEEWRQRSQHS